jgi:hypothetical protein
MKELVQYLWYLVVFKRVIRDWVLPRKSFL